MEDTAPHKKPPGITFDWRDWLPYLEDTDATDEEKRELIETLWGIVLAFVDLGFDINPTQETCGQIFDLKAVLEAAVLNSRGTHNKNTVIKDGGKDVA
jgi:hypothetical protein